MAHKRKYNFKREKLPNWKKTNDFAELLATPGFLEETDFPTNLWPPLIHFAKRIKQDKNLKIMMIPERESRMLLYTKNNIYPRPPPFLNIFLEISLKINNIEYLGINILVDSTNDETFKILYGSESVEELTNVSTKQIDERMDEMFSDVNPFLKEIDPKYELTKNSDGEWDFNGIPIDVLRQGLKKLSSHNMITLFNTNPNYEETKNRDEDDRAMVYNDMQKGDYKIIWYGWGIDYNDGTMFFHYDTIKFQGQENRLFSKASKQIDFFNTLAKESRKEMEDVIDLDITDISKCKKNISLMVCNFLDFLNNPNVKIFHYIPSEKNNNNPSRSLPQRSIIDYRVVRVKGELKRYMDRLHHGGSFNYSHKFWVRGHFRRYWNKEKYHKLYKKYNIGDAGVEYYWDNQYNVIMRWVLPYIKGEGLMLEQVYKMEK